MRLICLLLCVFLVPMAVAQTQLGDDINGEDYYDSSGSWVALSADGNRIAVGADHNDGNGSNSGHVRIYDLEGGIWTQVGADIDGEAAEDESGWSLALSADGNRVAIGAAYNDGNGSKSGHARVFDLVGGTWTQVGADIDGEAASDESGWRVALSSDGTRVAIGAGGNDGNGMFSGQARVFDFEGGSWTQVGADIDGEAVGDISGYSVALSSDGSRVAIGAPHNSGNGALSGHVRVYDLVDGAWTQVGADIDGEAADDRSGWSVALSSDGSRVAIGADRNDGNGSNSGHVRVFDLVGGVWTQVGADIDGEAAEDNSGWSIALSADGSRVAIGTGGNDANGSASGHVRIYDLEGGIWTQVGADIDGDAAADQFGWSVALSADGNRVAGGAVGNDEKFYGSGHVRVFELYVPEVSCTGFAPPMSTYPVTVKKNRALPLKAQLLDIDGYAMTDADFTAPPVLQVLFDAGTGVDPLDVTDEALSAGQATDGNQFVYSGGMWQFNLTTKNYSAPGTYIVQMDSGDDSEYVFEPTCQTVFVVD